MPAWSLALWVIGTYLVAAIPVGLLIGLARGVDLREIGSGNIGATNAVRALGKAWGILVLALDMLKAGVPVALAAHALGEAPHARWWVALVALSATLGHVYPVYLRFRGGKGVACALAIFVLIDPRAAAIGLIVYLLLLLLTQISALGSLTSVTVIALCLLADPHQAPPDQLLGLCLCALIWARHRGNIHELRELARLRKHGPSRPPEPPAAAPPDELK